MRHEPSPTVPIGVAPVLPEFGLRNRIADELDQLRVDLEEIGTQLCLDDEILHRCISFLQRFDEMGQRSSWLAALLRAEDPDAVIADITLQSLADRLSKS